MQIALCEIDPRMFSVQSGLSSGVSAEFASISTPWCCWQIRRVTVTLDNLGYIYPPVRLVYVFLPCCSAAPKVQPGTQREVGHAGICFQDFGRFEFGTKAA